MAASTTRPARTPNFVAFIGTGAILGFLLGGWVAWSGIFEEPVVYANGAGLKVSTGSSVGLLGLAGALVFGLLAAVIAVLVDRTGKQ